MTTEKSTKSGFSAEERAAMKERARELKAAKSKEADAQAVAEKIAAMPDADRALAERVHAVITSAAPALDPKLWYGSPAYAKNGKVICFFQESSKFRVRYATLGFNEDAQLDDGTMWATSFALVGINEATENRIADLVRAAVG